VKQKHCKRLLGSVVADFPDHTKILYVSAGNENAIKAYEQLGWVKCSTPDVYAAFAPTEEFGVTYLCYVYVGVKNAGA